MSFALLLFNTNSADIVRLARRVLSLLRRPFHIQGQVVNVSASLGCAQSTPATHRSLSFSQLLTQADIAMSKAKVSPLADYTDSQHDLTSQHNLTFGAQGLPDASELAKSGESAERGDRTPCIQGQYAQSRYAVFRPAMQAEVLARVGLQRALAKALDRNELRVHYQPIVSLHDSRSDWF